MIIERYKGYLLCETTSGGSAGIGFNKTASIKILSEDNQRHGRYFRFWKFFPYDRARAIEKARAYIDNILNKPNK